MIRPRILVVDDLECQSISDLLKGKEYDVQGVDNLREALKQIEKNRFDVVVADLSLNGKTGREGIEITRKVKASSPKTEVIVITAHGSFPTAVEAIRFGGFDFVVKEDCFPERLLESVGRALSLLPTPSESTEIVGESLLIKKAIECAVKAARSDLPVLLLGETGTGKELFARLIHKESPRCGKKFVSVNASVGPQDLAESNLFGHVKGSFTNADKDKEGLFGIANGGILFLDEVGEMPMAIQVKLLRALQEQVICRVGDTKEIKVDIRIIAATNADLKKLIREGKFREDLYYRLKVFDIKLPPLRERREDIPLLVDAFIQKNKKTKSDLDLLGQISRKALDLLMAYPWPGNVRELDNQIRRALILSGEEMIKEDHLSEEIRSGSQSITDGDAPKEKSLKAIEREGIIQALRRHQGNISAAAEELGITRPTLYSKMKLHGMNLEEILQEI